MGVLQQIWIYEILGGMLLICQNATVQLYGAWIRINYVLRLETYSIFGGSLFWAIADSRRAARGTCICETCLLYFFKPLLQIDILCTYPVKLILVECHSTHIMISEHWFG